MYKHVFRTLAQFAALAVVMTTIAAAQGLQTGEIAGRVSSQDGLSLPGVTVTVRSASLQGARTVVADANGNYHPARLATWRLRRDIRVGGACTAH